MVLQQLPLPDKEPPPELVIFSYARAKALADGVLVDVTETAREAGFRLPVAITAALHNRLTLTKADAALGQDYDGRLWDVLWLAVFTAKLPGSDTDTIRFSLEQQEANAHTGKPEKVALRLWANCGPGDNSEPVITIGFPEDF
jgi:hypothetical protein